MRLLLLGCTGFVGKELVPTLLNENHEIYIVSRKPISKLKVDLDFNKFKFFQIDLSKEKNWNNENLLNILREADGIINLMGEPSQPYARIWQACHQKREDHLGEPWENLGNLSRESNRRATKRGRTTWENLGRTLGEP